jgi:hypothetical protein
MNGFANLPLLMLSISGMAVSSHRAVIESFHANQDVLLDLDSTSEFWHGSRPVYMEKDGLGKVGPRIPIAARS